MFSAFLVCAACLAYESPGPAATDSDPVAGALSSYLQAKSQSGRTADDHVRLALWCEAHGLETERLKHLTIAVLKDPESAAARGLLGLVALSAGDHQSCRLYRRGGAAAEGAPPRPGVETRPRPAVTFPDRAPAIPIPSPAPAPTGVRPFAP
jgi:hypothetical protein